MLLIILRIYIAFKEI